MLEVLLTYPTPEGSQEIPLVGGRLSFGRGSEADYRFPDNGLSRLNSTIYREADNVWIVDENSTNGTFVNGSPVAPSGTPLRNGDSIKIGNETLLRVRIAPKQTFQAANSFNAAAQNSSVSVSSAPSGNLALLPIAVIAGAVFIISISAVVIGFKVFGSSEPPIAGQTDSYNTPISEDEDEDADKTPTPKPTAKPEKTANTSINSNTNLTDSPQGQTTVVQTNLPSGKKYLQMSDAEKKDYVRVKSEKLASLIGNRTGESITPLAVERIKGFLDAYASRQNVKSRGGGCRFGDNLQTTYERASKNAPFINKAFNERGVPSEIGLYLAMIESEHCICLQSGTGPLGMYQFTFATAKNHFHPNDGVIKGASPSNPDDRCKPEPAANAAAEYMKFLLGRYGTGPASVPLAIGSYNSGEGGLSTNLTKALESNETLPRDFWTMIANGEKLSKQFQSENFKYVPKFFAAAIVGENPQDFGLTLQSLSTITK